ncbi:hypothetical protein [Vallitalea guaymasensis]|uniref:hypothetical protein n=1 Tax=Vallitalea guaymasensis TaxID=1185412 RepID=UPI002357C56D|nr:hypothetical protein [Vallitalea guaymasensis]
MFKSVVQLNGTNNIMKIDGNIIYVCSDKNIIKIDKNTSNVIDCKKVFPKNGKSRDFIINGDFIYFREFCTCYRIDSDTLTIMNEWKLGNDLRTDICGICTDERNFYAGIRNGPLAIINKKTGQLKYYNVSDSSIWTIKADDFIYAGNVNGQILKIDKLSYHLIKYANIHKKNLKSMLLTKEYIYTGSQDLSLGIIDRETIECIDKYKNCHKKMFYLVGKWKNYIITASVPCGETKVWDISNHSLYKTINKATWNMTIKDSKLYMMDGGMISYVDMNKL